MIRIGDVLHAVVFAVCVAGGGIIAHALGRTTVQGLGYGLVAWIALMLLYLGIVRILEAMQARSRRAELAEPSGAAVEDDDTAFEIEDGKDD